MKQHISGILESMGTPVKSASLSLITGVAQLAVQKDMLEITQDWAAAISATALAVLNVLILLNYAANRIKGKQTGFTRHPLK